MALYQQCALRLEMSAGFQKNTNHGDNTSMSSLATVYRGEDLGKQIYTMHSTVVYTPVHGHQQVGCDKASGDKSLNSSTFKCGLRMHVAGWGPTVTLLLLKCISIYISVKIVPF